MHCVYYSYIICTVYNLTSPSAMASTCGPWLKPSLVRSLARSLVRAIVGAKFSFRRVPSRPPRENEPTKPNGRSSSEANSEVLVSLTGLFLVSYTCSVTAKTISLTM